MQYFLQGQLLTSTALNQNFRETINASGNYYITGMYTHTNNVYIRSMNTTTFFYNTTGTGYIGCVQGTGNATFLHFGPNTNIIANGASGQFTYVLTGDANKPGSIYWESLANLLGYIGTQGLKGDRGYTGSRGADGSNGLTGYTGSAAIAETGYKGSAGATGPTGPQGETGNTGATGDVGPTGPGPMGATGPQGDQGATGATGPAGDPGGATGATGPTGYTGSRSEIPGYVGSLGPRGYAGSQGEPGGIGDTGYRGSQGVQGDRGETGYKGSIGDTGYMGSLGYYGSVGYSGSEGPMTSRLPWGPGDAHNHEILWDDHGYVNAEAYFYYTKYEDGNTATPIMVLHSTDWFQVEGGQYLKLGMGGTNTVMTKEYLYLQTSDSTTSYISTNMYIHNDHINIMNLASNSYMYNNRFYTQNASHRAYLSGSNLNLTGDISLYKAAIPQEYQTIPATVGVTRSINMGGQKNIATVDYAKIDFINYDTAGISTDYVGARIASRNIYNGVAGDAGDLRFYTGDSSFINVHVLIAANGMVGINNVTPTATLTLGQQVGTSDKSTWGTLNVHGRAVFTKNVYVYGKTYHYQDVDMGNYAINHADRILFNDPGFQEGCLWQGGNEWGIFETVDDYLDISNVGGDLQIAYDIFSTNGVRHSAFRYPDIDNPLGKFDVSGNVVVGWDLWVNNGVYASLLRVYDDDAIIGNTIYITTANGGFLGVREPTPNAELFVRGNANITGNVWIGGALTAEKITVYGANQQVLYNYSNTVAGSNNFTYNQDLDKITVGNIEVSGNLTVQGLTTYLNTQTLTVNDNIIVVAENNLADTIDFGTVGRYVNSTASMNFAGMFRDASDGKFYLMSNYDSIPGATIDRTSPSFKLATIVADRFEGSISGTSDTANTSLTANNAYYLGSVGSEFYLKLYDNATLSGNIIFSGSNVIVNEWLTANNLTVYNAPTLPGLTIDGTFQHHGLDYTIGTNIDQVVTRTDTMVVTPSWTSTTVNNDLLITGSYYVQLTTAAQKEVYTGLMSWVADDPPGVVDEEITLHKAHTGTSTNYLYLRVYRGPSTNTALQIAGDVTRASDDYSFKIRRML